MEPHFKNHIVIGLAGKRKHAKLNIIDEKLNDLFKALDESLGNCEIIFFTGLADGADQIAAKAFNEHYANTGLSKEKFLGAILPFNSADYEKTITQKKGYQDLYATCQQVLELDGKNINGNDGDSLRDKAYQQQGSALARLSDILIVIAPKSDGGKTGGSVQTLLTMLGLKKPVIFLNLDDQQFYLYENMEQWFHGLSPMKPEAICKALFKSDFSLPDVNINEKMDSGWIFKARAGSWGWFDKTFKGKKLVSDYVKTESPHNLFSLLNTLQEEIDRQSVYFQTQYRGGYILNYLLAFFAILLAVISLTIYTERSFLLDGFFVWSLFIIGCLKLAILILLLINTNEINKHEYNRKAIDFRFAAERLRVNVYMSILGIIRSPAPSLGNHSKKQFSQYNGESIYQKAIFNALRLKYTFIVSKENILSFLKTLKMDWIKGQISYHESESRRMKLMDSRLQNIPELLSKVIIGVVAIDLIIAFLVEIIKIVSDEEVKHFFDIFLPYMLALAAFIPAVITTLNSIQFQSEAHRLSVRSQLMHEELLFLDKKIDEITVDIEQNDEGCNFATVLNLIDETANILTDEVAEWSLIYERRVFDQ